MTMLSRVAERLFWMARYLERAEDTARLTHAYTHMALDIPKGSEPGWDTLVRIQDAQYVYSERYRVYNEQNVLKFMIADKDNVGGILNAIIAARENVRTTRDVLPEEAWEHVNELYLYANEYAEKSVGRRNRYQFLEEVIRRCQAINGMMESTMPRDHAYRFIRLGRLIERADMTTRVIDVGAAAQQSNDIHHSSVDPLIWASVLKSLSAMSAYRREFGPLVEVNNMVDFILRDTALPRSVKFCLNGIREELLPLKNHKSALKLLESSRGKLSRFNSHIRSQQQLHRFIDQFQAGLITLSAEIASTWFLKESE